MRKREEIEKNIEDGYTKAFKYTSEGIIIELLLDIRDWLDDVREFK